MMAVAAGVYWVLRLAGFHQLFVNDAEGMGALLEIIGTLYSVVYAFATYVIWGQFAAVENEILKESGALKDLILFSKGRKEARSHRPLRTRLRPRSPGVGMGNALQRRGQRADRQAILRNHLRRYRRDCQG